LAQGESGIRGGRRQLRIHPEVLHLVDRPGLQQKQTQQVGIKTFVNEHPGWQPRGFSLCSRWCALPWATSSRRYSPSCIFTGLAPLIHYLG